jgi:ribosomal protein S18 acetylase RimI-like enzyme
MRTRLLNNADAQQVADLHIEGINAGFISTLGPKFVKAMYEAIARSDTSFGLVYEEDQRILGFVTFTPNLTQLYKSVIFRNGFRLGFLLAGKLFSFRVIKRIFETLLYPHRMQKKEVPSAELLSIAVSANARGKGVGYQLVQEGLEMCRRRGIDRLKLLVGVEDLPPNKLYLKCGFKLADQIDNHNELCNLYIWQAENRSLYDLAEN